MTISHPAKVNVRILASGIDTLYLSIDVDWEGSDELFSVLQEAQDLAKACCCEYQVYLRRNNPDESWPFVIFPHGSKGYAWIIQNSDFTIKLANSPKSKVRSNVSVEIRSEALWRLGPEECIRKIGELILSYRGSIEKIKVSRADLCIDFFMPHESWNEGLFEYAVTRAVDKGFYHSHDMLTGVRIGKGAISARLYDKPLEIKQQSRKTWMYCIWGVEQVPEDCRLIRLEFQLRREVIKQLGINAVGDLFLMTGELWSYCTREWLKFQDRPGAHHTQRKTFEWYEQIQNGFMGIQGAEPLVRAKVEFSERKRLLTQGLGYLVSLRAVVLDEHDVPFSKPVALQDCLNTFYVEWLKIKDKLPDIQERIVRKRARNHRTEPGLVEDCPF